MNPIRGCDLDARIQAPLQPDTAPPKSARTLRPGRRPHLLSRRHAQMIETLVTVGWTMTPLAAATLALALDTIV
jgi:hypothetical protein